MSLDVSLMGGFQYRSGQLPLSLQSVHLCVVSMTVVFGLILSVISHVPIGSCLLLGPQPFDDNSPRQHASLGLPAT